MNHGAESHTILVTGGAGYIGSRLLACMAEDPRFADATIRIYDNLRRSTYDGLMDLPADGRFEFIEGDILDRTNVRRAMSGVREVVHLAALVRTPLSFEHPEWTEQVNHWGASGVAECALEAGVRRFVYASSASVYGLGGPFAEDAPCRPTGPYATSKLRGEKAVLSTAGRGMEVVSVRLGTTFGTAPAMRFDTVADRFAFKAGVKHPLVIHGDGSQMRPLIHVDDAAAVFMMCLDPRRAPAPLLNAATINTSVLAISEALREILPDVEVRHTDQEADANVSFTVNSSRLQSYGFEARHTLRSGLEEMLRRWKGFQSRVNAQA